MGKTWSAGAAAIAATAAIAFALAACGSETIDAGDLEGKLADTFAEQAREAGDELPEVSVDCPDDQEAEEGNQFDCTLTGADGPEVTIAITLTDDEGGYEASVPPEQFE